MFSTSGFNRDSAADLAQSTEYAPIPMGQYTMIVEEATATEGTTASGDNAGCGWKAIKMKISVCMPDGNTRPIFPFLILQHEGAAKKAGTAGFVARNQIIMSDICASGNVAFETEDDVYKLTGVQFMGELKIKNGKDQDGNPRKENELSKIILNSPMQQPQMQQQQPQMQQQAMGNGFQQPQPTNQPPVNFGNNTNANAPQTAASPSNQQQQGFNQQPNFQQQGAPFHQPQ